MKDDSSEAAEAVVVAATAAAGTESTGESRRGRLGEVFGEV